MSEPRVIPEDDRSLAPHWVRFSDTNPPCGEFYWLLNSNGRDRIVAHFDNESRWSSTDVNGEQFTLEDTYTHWTHIREPSING